MVKTEKVPGTVDWPCNGDTVATVKARRPALRWQSEPDTNLPAHFLRLSQGCRGVALRGAFVGISVIDRIASEGHQSPSQLFERGIVWQEEHQKILEPMRLGEGEAAFD